MSLIVGVIMGSESDFKTMQEAIDVLQLFGVEHEVSIVSAHRTPEVMFDYAKQAKQRGLKVIIAGAGGAAHLPGMVAALTPLPVIGIPIQSKTLSGVDSLLSIAQMPFGVPVATMAIGGAKNGALMAIKILAIYDSVFLDKLFLFSQQQQQHVLHQNESIKK